jgi:hypothetical protein
MRASATTTSILPIAGIAITCVLVASLIGSASDKNSPHDVDTWVFFKAWVAIFIAAPYSTRINGHKTTGLSFRPS